MIDDKTIKSLYDDKPTLMEWLKRVEAQLEELKKITNFDTLTANSADIKADLKVGGKAVARAVYVHRLTFTYGGTSRFYYRVLSTKGEPYASLTAVFADKINNSIDNAIVVDFTPNGCVGLLKFSDAGAVVDAVGLTGGDEEPVFKIIDNSDISFVSDEVVGRWNA